MATFPQPPFDRDRDRERREPLQFPRPKPRSKWKRIAGWTAAGIGILFAVLVVAAVVLLHSARFRQYVLRTAEQKAATALGTAVTARDFSLTFSGISPTLDLYNASIAGAPPYPSPPLLTVERLRVGITISSLLHRSWYVNDIAIDRPVVRVLEDGNGRDNLPQMASSSNQQSNTNVFDLGIRHATLSNGEAWYNNRKAQLDADLHDLTFRSEFDARQKKYAGTLSYRDGHLKMGAYNPLPHDLDASFSATQQEFTLNRAVLAAAGSRVTLEATAKNYSSLVVDGRYDAVLDTAQLARIMNNASLPAGTIHAAGVAHYDSQNNKAPLMAALTLHGNMGSNALLVKTPSLAASIRNLGATYAIDHGNAEVRDLHASLLGGQFTGGLTMTDLGGNTHSHLQAALHNLELSQLKPVLRAQSGSTALNGVNLSGAVNATADATWGKTTDNMVARADATIQGAAGPQDKAAAGANPGNVPLNAVIHARYAAASKQVALDQSYVRMAQTSITANGTISKNSALQVRLQSNDLHELETAAALFSPPSKPLGLGGQASFNAAVSGSTAAPHVTGQLTATNLKVRGSAWKQMRASLNASPSSVSIENGELDPADRGRIAFAATAALHHWKFNDTSAVQATLHALNVNIENLTRLAGSQAPVTGTLAANVQVSGNELNPVGHGTMSLTGAKIAAEPVKSVNLNFQGTGNELHSTLAVQLPTAGTANAVLTYMPKTKAYDVQLTADGIRLEQLQTVKDKNLQVAGVLNMNASGRGTLDNPGLQAAIEIPQLTLQNQTMKGIRFNTMVANHAATFALDSEVLNTSARAHGSVNLTGQYEANAAFDTQAIPFAPLVAIYAPAQAGALTGQTEIHGWLRGPLKDKARLAAQLTIPQLAVNYKNTVQIAAAEPIRADYANGTLTLQRGAIRGTGTDLEFQGRIPVADRNQPLALMLMGSIDLKLAQMLDPDIASSGQLKFNIDSTGARANPNVAGQVQVVNANFATGDVPIGLENGNGVLTLTKDHLEITKFSASAGGGTLTATGGVAYRPALQFDVGLQGQGVRLLYPGGIRATMGTQLALTGNTDNALLSGRVRVNQLSFTPQFDLMNFAGSLGGGTTPPPASGFSSNLKLNIQVQSTNDVNLVSRTLSVNGAANLRVTGSGADPVILGRVNINSGDLIFQGNRYVLNGGTVDFINPVETDPVVNLNVSTTIKSYNIQLRLWGPAEKLHTNYASDPALPPADIINLIAFGTTTEASAANPQPANMAAESAVASQVTGQVTNRIEKVAGISQLSIDPELGGQGSNQNPGARITIQQRVASNIFVTFATDVNSTQDQEIKVEYKATPRVSVNAVRDQNGGFAMEAQLHKKW
ncbi:MAG: translocation/assembly module TamB domain-containing protein [Acidobacteria bacterium]|nr:translocation/assembly module TamB domain-containing protein [Acidobacteriota bacterium]